MSIPEECTVLVIGSGPGGSYTAATLAREGIEAVVLEADVFPRYHIGESMLASMRHFLRFIDLDSTFKNYGFKKKVGAAFKLVGRKHEGYTDFVAAGGPENYAWNVVRSEADDLMFRHAGKCGAKMFDGVKVNSIEFAPLESVDGASKHLPESAEQRRPISATYTRKSDGISGTIKFKYVVDASGRSGLLSTKYLKNRKFNDGFKNIANWGYWKGTTPYALGTPRENSPYFEVLKDESGWAWAIPLHDGTTSVGIVVNQEVAIARKRAQEPSQSTKDFYLSTLQLSPELFKLVGDGELITDVKSASDYSYSASSYALPYARVVGDAGAFIDPFFSSGVHLALVGGLSAATTISAALRGDCEESVAMDWHSTKVAEAYTRFLIVVMSAYRQIRRQSEPILSDLGEDNFDRAFAHFRPIIQGTADMSNKLAQKDLTQMLDFCVNAFEPTLPEAKATLLKKIEYANAANAANGESASATPNIPRTKEGIEVFREGLSSDELQVMKHIQARKMMRAEDIINIESFSTDVINGLSPNLHRGSLGLAKAKPIVS